MMTEREPGLNRSVAGAENSPPVDDSQITTCTASPTPMVWPGTGVCWPNVPCREAACHRSMRETMWGSTSIRAKRVSPVAVGRAALVTSEFEGPDAGSEHEVAKEIA